jgi:gamma-glutamyltranspeptidase
MRAVMSVKILNVIVKAFDLSFQFIHRYCYTIWRSLHNFLQLVANLTSRDYTADIRLKIDDNMTHDIMYYEPTFDYVPDQGTVHLNVLAPDGSAVALSGTINLLSVGCFDYRSELCQEC